MRILAALPGLAETGTGNVKRLQGIDPPEFGLCLGYVGY